MKDDSIECGPELGDPGITRDGCEGLIKLVELPDDPGAAGLGGDPDGLQTGLGGAHVVAGASVGPRGTGEVDTAIAPVGRGESSECALEAIGSLVVSAKGGVGAGPRGVDVRNVEPGAPNAVVVGRIQESKRGVVVAKGISFVAKRRVSMGLMHNGNYLKATTGACRSAGGGGEPKSVGGMAGVDSELRLAAEDVRGQCLVAGHV
ncbi:hypothetical protein OG520_44780 (plasmid) [Streptomyces sp. NBC_00984]|uniref:hypothetical protein n=1 Tax=Streptomyces sp. NBC_00984 TaxID=2903700 RepID=UPI002F90C84F|nr:hypothetical protein OG520_44780 [Streptomyces sp. NBC_00984]